MIFAIFKNKKNELQSRLGISENFLFRQSFPLGDSDEKAH